MDSPTIPLAHEFCKTSDNLYISIRSRRLLETERKELSKMDRDSSKK